MSAYVAAIVAGLTKTQRQALRDEIGSKQIVNSLLNYEPRLVSGVTYHASFSRLRRFTPAGSAVRAALLAQEQTRER